jgi:hypothetical protein
MFNADNLIRQKQSKQKELERKMQRAGIRKVRDITDPEVINLKHQIDLIDLKLQKH